MNTAWRLRQDRKRTLVSWGSVLVLYGIAFLAVLLTAKTLDTVLAEKAGPVMVRLGNTEGAENPPRIAPEAPPEKPDERVAPRPEVPDRTPKPAPEKPEVKVPEKPATTPIEKSVEKPLPATVKGREQGNTLDMTFDATAGSVGRNLYVPIYLFMPLPSSLDVSLVERFTVGGGMYTREERIRILTKHYERDGAKYTLKSMPEFQERSEAWLALEGAGYGIDKAEYKASRTLKPVTIAFTVGTVADKTRAALEKAEITASSGNAEVDAAVLYGFSRASFFNSTDRGISGLFVYRFE